MTRRFVLAALATVLLAPPASAQIGEMKLHDFAAKWMVQQDDFADIGAWREANRILLASADHRPRIVLMGDSITYHWQAKDLPAPAGLNLLNRGVAGQNTTQMLLRFEDDVIALKPAAVVILGGTNDLRAYVGDPAGQAGGMVERIGRNLTAMADIADARGVKVVLCAVPPIGVDHDALQRDPAAIVKVNAWIRAFAAQRGYPFVDYHGALADPAGALSPALSADGLHPTAEGYRRMGPPLAAAISQLKLGGD